MSNTKVIVDFTDYPAADLAPVARHIENQMTANAATFDAPPITMVALGTLIDTYETRLTARASKATADILAFNETRDELEDRLADLGNYVNSVAKGDAMECDQSGFPVYTTGSTPDTSPPAAPTDLRLKHAGVTGGGSPATSRPASRARTRCRRARATRTTRPRGPNTGSTRAARRC